MLLLIFGLSITFIFWIIENRVKQYINSFQERAKELDEIFNYKQWIAIPETSRFLKGDFAISLMFFSVCVVLIILAFI